MRHHGWIALLVAALVVSGCGASQAPPSESPKVTLGTPFDLVAGDTASLTPDPLEVTFVGVSEDSRCPSGVQCVWAGQAVINIKVAPTGGGPGTATLTLGGAKSGMDKASFGLFNVQITALAPVPVADAATKPQDYVATLVITKK